MLDIATVLITMFTYIDDYCKSRQAVRPGPRAKMSDSELITISLFCELSGKSSEYEQIRYVEQWLKDYFPHLIDRTRYNRRMRRLVTSINEVRTKVLREVVMAVGDVRILDSTPIPVITFQRAHFTPLFPEATYGRCPARKLTYFGFKFHLVTDLSGIPIHFDLSAANIHDVDTAEELLTYNSADKLVLADKGYLSKPLKQRLKDRYGIDLLTPSRANQKVRESKSERILLNSWRQRIEVVNAILKGQLHFEKTFAKTLGGLVRRIMAKMTALTIAIYINKLFGRPPFEIASLVP